MSEAVPTTQSILTNVLRKIGVLSVGETSPQAEDLDVALSEFNGIVGEWNTRKRFAFFQRAEAFTFTTSKQSYSIGAAADTPDFVVSAGVRPARIEFAQLVLTAESPDAYIPIRVINVDQYQEISLPALSSDFPLTIYYKPTWPTGTIIPWPAFPTTVTNQLNLTWWNQLETVALADIATALILPFGYRRAIELATAVACVIPFGAKRVDLEELKRQERIAIANIQSLNVTPPKMSTVATSGRTSYNWLTGPLS